MIVTFYSYKGGTGRTMALANIAVLLARAGRRVLMVDFDLEAPGIWRYFADLQGGLDRRDGLLELLQERRTSWRASVVPIPIGAQPVSLLTSGRQDDTYPARLLAFDWQGFFDADGGEYFERLRADWQAEYDFVLIDSRTGVTDIGGICTILLPDMIVPVFVANAQNVDGVVDVLRRAQKGRQDLAYDRAPALVLPLLSRFDGRTELELVNEWLTIAANKLGEFYTGWLPIGIEPRHILERTKLPYVAYFAFGEKLAVLLQGVSDPDSLGFALNAVATMIDSGLSDLSKVLPDRISARPTGNDASPAPLDDSWLAVVHSRDATKAAAFAVDRRRLLTAGYIAEWTDIKVAFPKATGNRLYDVVRVSLPEDRQRFDGAVLHLAEPLPDSITPAPLSFVPPAQLVGSPWWAFGFPTELGRASRGTIDANLSLGLLQLEPTSRTGIEAGFGGTALWSSARAAVVGIVVATAGSGSGIGVSLHRVDVLLPGERLRALGDPVTGSARLGPLHREQFVDQLATIAGAESEADALLRRIHFPPGRRPPFSSYASAELFWDRILVDLENGIIEGGVARLAEAALSLYPANRTLQEIAASLRAV
jgi:cellulose biosynthesis protein BcsQ